MNSPLCRYFVSIIFAASSLLAACVSPPSSVDETHNSSTSYTSLINAPIGSTLASVSTPAPQPVNQTLDEEKAFDSPPPDVSTFKQFGRASWYGKPFAGRRTANGERYDMYAMTAAHKTLPLASYVRVTNTINKKSVIVRINDRGPYVSGRVIDLSLAAARKLGLQRAGTAPVKIEGLTQEEAQTQRAELVAAANNAQTTPEN